MQTENEAIVSRSAFVTAVHQRRISRTRFVVRGARSKVPRDILIYADGSVLIVDTPMVAFRLPMDGNWGACLSVSAAALAITVRKLKPGDLLSIIFAAGSLIIDGGAFVVPAKEVSRPPAQ